MVGKLTVVPDIIEIGSRDEFDAEATNIITQHIGKQLDAKGSADLLLSGGSTPKSIYSALADMDLDWNRIRVGQVDERWVPFSDPGSNAGMIRRTLLRRQARGTQFLPMKSRHKTAKAGRASLDQAYQAFNLSTSIAVLGMGPDGHTAGWFPAAQGLDATLDMNNANLIETIIPIPSKVTGPYLERITLTLSALAQCNHLLLLTSGDEKLSVLKTVLSEASEELPLTHLVKVAGHNMTCLHSI